jgi:hypothetical protein
MPPLQVADETLPALLVNPSVHDHPVVTDGSAPRVTS